MKTSPIVPAQLDYLFDDAGRRTPYSRTFQDIYHAKNGAFEQAQHVFLAGNDLPQRWRGKAQFVILETGFGLGNNFLATWSSWRQDPNRCTRLIYIAIEKHPLTPSDMQQVHAHSPVPDLAQSLITSWPLLTPNMHRLHFEENCLQLQLVWGEITEILPELVASVDAFFLDGFAPAKNPAMWSSHVCKALARLAAPQATLATWSVARLVRDGLSTVGFKVQRQPGLGHKREQLVGHYEPYYRAPPLPAGLRQPQGAQDALIIGGGLAGCATAWALAEQGWRSTIIDQYSGPAMGTSGNPAGLFHGAIHGFDGIHARLHRAAALMTQQVAQPWLDKGLLAGSCRGLLRLSADLTSAQAKHVLALLGLPTEYVCWLEPSQAKALLKADLSQGGWWFPQGGWLDPGAYAKLLFKQSQAGWLGDCQVSQLTHSTTPRPLWQVWDVDGNLIASAPVVVLAIGAASLAFLPATGWLPPSTAVRGQISWFSQLPPACKLPPFPLAGAGYSIPTAETLVFGATQHEEDLEPAVRASDHSHNLAQLKQLGLLPADYSGWETSLNLAGRVGWRAVTPDRLPLIGPVLNKSAVYADRPQRDDHPRFYPRLQDDYGGLYVLSGLGSRGITWAALAGRVLASWVCGTPAPVERDLLYALDPGRFAVKGG